MIEYTISVWKAFSSQYYSVKWVDSWKQLFTFRMITAAKTRKYSAWILKSGTWDIHELGIFYDIGKIVVKTGQGLGWNATITVHSLVYLLSSRIARCRSVVCTGSIVLGRQPLYFWLFFKIGYTTVSFSLYIYVSVHSNIWSSSPD